jgi:hypothetical protein
MVTKHQFSTAQSKRMNLETKLFFGNVLLSIFYGCTTFGSWDSSVGVATGYRLDG